MRTHTAIEAENVRSPFFQAFGENLGWRAFRAVAVFFDRHLHNQWPVADLANGADSRENFIQIEKRFEHEGIHAAIEQRLCLFAKDSLRFVDRSFAPGLDANSKWTDGSRHEYTFTRGLPGDAGALNVDLAHLLRQAVCH